MKQFAELINEIDSTTATNKRVDAIVRYFQQADQKDIIWTIALLTGRRPKRSINTTFLRNLAAKEGGIPEWLFEESYHIVGDLAETVSLILPETKYTEDKSLDFWIRSLMDLKDQEDDIKQKVIADAWKSMDQMQRFVFNKLITGGFRIGVSRKLLTKALSKYSGIEENLLAHKLMGNWDPFTITLDELLHSDSETSMASKPFPFYLAYALDVDFRTLGSPQDWIAERKWDGIRGQIIIRNDAVFVWSRGEELVTDKFPEFFDFNEVIPNGTVLDGEIMAYENGPLDFQILQTRIGRKKISNAVLKKVPISFMVYDILEYEGEDIRSQPQFERRQLLEKVIEGVNHSRVMLSPTVDFATWKELEMEREESAKHRCEGIMLKARNGEYKTGRRRGEWWKWKVDPYVIDAVLIYAMRGHGRRANLYTDYTFAVWDDNGELIPFTKAYSGLTDDEFRQVDNFVKRNTIERFGPVRSVKPELVFEIAFEGISLSTRHKSGVALRFPRMNRWRKDKKASEANRKEDLMALIRMRNEE